MVAPMTKNENEGTLDATKRLMGCLGMYEAKAARGNEGWEECEEETPPKR
jgi:hypothetical protein